MSEQGLGENMRQEQQGSTEMPKERVMLITPEQLDSLPDGTELTSLFGEKVVKGESEIGTDKRGDGFIAYGFPENDLPVGMVFDEGGLVNVQSFPDLE